MMSLGLAAVCLGIAALCAGAWLYGWRFGYREGRKRADNWWLGIEETAEDAQREMWREELK